MSIHIGHQVRAVAVRSHRLSWLASELDISPRTLRNWFDLPDLSPDRVSAIGLVIGYDFRKDFPSLQLDPPADPWQLKYTDLLETISWRCPECAEKLGIG